MSKQPANMKAATEKPATPLKARAAFAAASFSNLRAAIGEGQGEPLRILLVDIDEDPNQPRTWFDDAELDGLAESIKAHGVVQPIVVRPAVNGRYVLAFGARRLRASKLAGVADIPVVIRADGADNFAAQVIENQQRANLSNSDLAAAIERLASEGCTNKQIGVICALKDYQVAAFRQVGNFPSELRERIDNGDVRALYDLFRQWNKTPAEVIDALPASDTFITITEARRIIGGITGKPTGSIILDRQISSTATPDTVLSAPLVAEPRQPGIASKADDNLHGASPLPVRDELSSSVETDHITTPVAIPAATKTMSKPPQALRGTAPTFIVQGKGTEYGRLVVDQWAEREGWALVQFSIGIEEVELSELRIVRIE